MVVNKADLSRSTIIFITCCVASYILAKPILSLWTGAFESLILVCALANSFVLVLPKGRRKYCFVLLNILFAILVGLSFVSNFIGFSKSVLRARFQISEVPKREEAKFELTPNFVESSTRLFAEMPDKAIEGKADVSQK